ncbi:lipocalin/fatty-acid binding family protein [Marinifilum sp. D737]|uniref:lipocalin/fatty-acid binding family protein n=1 Tax=Marinifilum sp. D737 TaxID=2969628 RepID=UPI002DD45193|nr:lipocalin/fatty-acid binding family protein [Marinifilum sp. D737]
MLIKNDNTKNSGNMAIVKRNIITTGLSGKLGNNLVFRQRKGKTILSVAVHYSGKRSFAQEQQKNRFKKASLYANTQKHDPELMEEYNKVAKEKGIYSGYNLAVSDYFHPPTIEKINIRNYHGEIGDVIEIIAFDDFKVKRIELEIYSSDGNLIEKGLAYESNQNGKWHYAASVANSEYKGDKIVVKAFDYPGNETDKEVVLD